MQGVLRGEEDQEGSLAARDGLGASRQLVRDEAHGLRGWQLSKGDRPESYRPEDGGRRGEGLARVKGWRADFAVDVGGRIAGAGEDRARIPGSTFFRPRVDFP